MHQKISFRLLFVSAFTILMTACSTQQEITVEQVEAALVAAETHASAGIVNIDITPPPGMPKGGYSTNGRSGIGFRTRLKARIFYLNDGKGQSLALVQTDLAGSSLLLHHTVSEAVAAQTGLSAKDIVITGTHSHSSVASHFDNDFYNKHFSNEAGLDPEYLSFITERLATAIKQAVQQRRPARVATGRKDIYGYNRNRMLAAYKLNPGKENINIEDPETKFQEVNPSLYMVRIDLLDDQGRYKPAGAFSSFSIHGTTLSEPTEVYSADVFAYVQRDLEWAIKEKYQTPWDISHGFTTGTQGDMAPALADVGDNYISHFAVDFKASRTLGQGIAKQAITLFESLDNELQDELVLATAAREINISEKNKIENIELCQQAFVGNTTAGGAYERRTPWLNLVPMLNGASGSKRWWFGKDGCQGSKRILGTSLLQPLFEPTESFPNMVLFQIMRINDMLILPLPFEITSESGRRISARVKSEFLAAKQNIKHSWVASVANGYFGYSATPEEYEYQSYEGASTLYGRYTTPYISAQLGVLAKDMQLNKVEELQDEWKYLLKTNHFLPVLEKATGIRKVLTDTEYVLAENEHEENYYAIEWQDVGPSQIDFHQPLVKVEMKTDQGWQVLAQGQHLITDEGYDVEVRLLDTEDKGMGTYQVRWYNPEISREACKAGCRFVIAKRGQQEQEKILYSAEFNL
ncbi:MAG: neutral/alkaline non-lysosomal ceramidase N-terminal domain-containing protein [Oleispira sp.]